MPPISKVDLYAAIRRDAREGLSQRALERKYGVGRRTVLKALASAWPELRKPLPPRPSRLDPFKALIDGMLRADLDAPRKQRHTAKRIFDRLIDEHGMTDVVLAENVVHAGQATWWYSLRMPPSRCRLRMSRWVRGA